jgi:hypothetical protein
MAQMKDGPWSPKSHAAFERNLSDMEQRVAIGERRVADVPVATERRRAKPVKKEIIGFARDRNEPDIGDTGVVKKLREWQRRGLVPKKNGGAVSAAEAKRIAERVVGEHVRYPAPKGHKGFEKIYTARR